MDRHVLIDYTNWRGERALRKILPFGLVFGSNQFHPEPQWLVQALDLKKGENRSFALKDIHSWKPLSE